LKNKMRKLHFEINRKRATDILELIHTDVNGPHNTTGYDGSRYFLSIIDDYSRLTNLYTMNSEAKVYECIESYVNQFENLTGKRVKRIRCDNGKEYINKTIENLSHNEGIICRAMSTVRTRVKWRCGTL